MSSNSKTATTTSTSTSGIGFGGALFLVFLVLKLTGYIDWSWWYVTAPLWGPLAFVGGILLVAGVLYGVAGILDFFERRSKEQQQ
ncbi:hypothetical protein [Nocardia asiatica]|uniref:hypothetical protein n=1 Tax=Nocardia asiatica TaxID=209252 RepID=UPI0024549A48|nr:hypothetical protein [Nocardia asiatica]